MLRSFDSLAIRQMRTRRLRVGLTAFGIVLGVGMVFGVLVLVGTIRHTFDELIDSAWGRTDLVAVSKSGGQIPEAKLAAARRTDGVQSVAPTVEQIFRRLHPDGRPYEGQAARMLITGFEPTNPGYDFRFVAGRQARAGPEIVVEEKWAEQRGVRLGDPLYVGTSAGRARLRVVGVFRFSSGLSFGEQGLAGVPLATARRLFQQPTGYGQLLIEALDRSRVGELQRRLQKVFGPGVDVDTPEGYSDQIAKQFQGFNVVLFFFSGIALFVGGFLILNSFNMTVLQRMLEIGMLRTLGATRGMVTRSVLTEALLIGALGTVLGLGLGLALAKGLVAMIGDLGIPVSGLSVTAGSAVTAAAVGLVATTLGALHPARRAGRVSPVRAVLGGPQLRRRPSLRRGLLGLALFLPGLWLSGRFWFGDASQGSSLAAMGGVALTMAMFVGMAIAAPFLIMPIVRVLAGALRRVFPATGRLAADSARANPARTAATAVALTIGLSVIVVNSAMSKSFLGTINDQLNAAYLRDYTVQPEGQPLAMGGQTFGPSVRDDIAALPDVAVAASVRTTLLRLPESRSPQEGLVMAVDPARWGEVDRTPIKGASRAEALAGLARGGIVASTGYSKSARLKVGDSVLLRGPGGARRARVVGILDASVGGLADTMQLSLSTMRDVYGITSDTQVAVKARSDDVRPAVGREIDRLLRRDYPQLEALSTAEVKDQIKGQIDQQFGLFNAILAIAVIVSLLGVVNTLAMSVMERTREIGVLRALGSSRWQIRGTMLDESLLITISGALAGVIVGIVIAFVWVQGLDTFMPGISFRFPLGTTLVIGLAAVALGAIAALVPAQRAARLDPTRAISYE